MIDPRWKPFIPAEPEAPKLDITAPKVDPFDFDQVGGLMGSCARWTFEKARSPIREFAVFSAITLFAALFGRRALGPTGLGTNLMLIMVAPTGSGKDWPLKSPRVILLSMGAFGRKLIGPKNVTGDSALERALHESPFFFMGWDEFGLLLQAATDPKAPAWTNICRALRRGNDHQWC